MTCPVCRSDDLQPLYPNYSGPCITSDMMVLPDAAIENCVCRSCGLIFNAAGTRGYTEAFYRDSYSLMMRSAESGIQSFAGAQPISQAERTYQILRELVDLPPEGRMLEAGAGKGEFLTHFTAGLPGWSVSAFEPSEAHEVLCKRFPQHRIERCEFRAFHADSGSYDLVVALGVLEHVENPLEMLLWGHALLADGGVFYIRVPNFAKNPNDLFCADHLSKLTEATLRSLAAAAGFSVVDVKESGVPIFLALRKDGAVAKTAPPNAFETNRLIADANAAVIRRSMEAILRARSEAAARGERFAIFGLGAAGLFAPLFAGFPAEDIAAYIDENRGVWGGQIHGRPIGGLDLLGRERIRHVALAISPVYTEQVSVKLRPLGVEIYVA